MQRAFMRSIQSKTDYGKPDAALMRPESGTGNAKVKRALSFLICGLAMSLIFQAARVPLMS